MVDGLGLGVVLAVSAVVVALDAPAIDFDEALLNGEGLTLDAKADDERLVLLALKTIYEQTNWQILGMRNLVITPGEGLTVDVVIENEDTKERLIRSGEYDRATNQWTDRIISESKADEALDLDQWRVDKAKGKGSRKPRTEKPKCNTGQPCGMSCIRRKSASGKDVKCRFKPEGAAEEALQSVTGGGGNPGGSSANTVAGVAAIAKFRSGIEIQDENHPEVQNHLKALSLIPQNVIDAVNAKGGKVVVGAKGMGDFMPELKGITPRGWPPSLSWDDIAGGYARDLQTAYAGIGRGSSSGEIALHEYGHMVGVLLNRDTSSGYNDDSRIKALQSQLYDNFHPYLQQGGKNGSAGRSEFFAELFSATLFNKGGAISEFSIDAVTVMEDILREIS